MSYQLFSNFLNFILPRVCVGCRSILTNETAPFCSTCYNSFQIAKTNEINAHFISNFAKTGFISDFKGLYIFKESDPIQEVIHSFKYRQQYKAAYYMGELMGKLLFQGQTSSKIDFIVPLPLHPVRMADRGYNQSDYICRGISPFIQAPVISGLLTRAVNTQTQTGLTAVQRKENVSGAFSIKKGNRITGKVILLVDDVKTTGATINECARELTKFAPAKIIAATLAVVK